MKIHILEHIKLPPNPNSTIIFSKDEELQWVYQVKAFCFKY